jgi:formate hydrogenlyase subunit 3/multisubunit Na+/H+ antiporter MnhD subunit
MESNTAALFMLLPSAPIVLVYLAGIIVALVNASRYRKPAMYALAGFIALLLAAMVRAAATVLTLPEYRGNLSIQELGVRLASINLGASALTIAGTVLVLLAVFADRSEKARYSQS